MKKLYIILLVISSFAMANDTTAVFSASVKQNFSKYITASNEAFQSKNFELAEQLFDSLVDKSFKGTQFDDFSFNKLGSGNRFKLSSVGKPILLLTYSSWCILGNGEIEAVNKLAKEYKNKMQIVVVFWDRKDDMKKIGSQFNSAVEVCYAHETNKEDLSAIKLLKKTFGFPASYVLDENMEVVDINKNFVSANSLDHKDVQVSMNNYYQKFNASVASIVVRPTDYGVAVN
jgi:thiol-disulfide isomerase/thioredoxin